MQTLGGLPGSGLGTGALWVEIGPAPLRSFNTLRPDAGEVVDIAIDPTGTADQIIYVACNDGGIWKSTDGGSSWRATTDLMPSLSMGAVALDPANPTTVYAGTGNLFDGGMQFSKGMGIYRSIDGGETWSIVTSQGFTHAGINRIVAPLPGVLVVATINGLYYSVDGGQHFGANPPTFDDGAPVLPHYVTDLVLDTQDPTTVYACVAGQGVLVSHDAGASFPADLFANPGAPAPPFAFITMAQSSQPDGQTMYASVAGLGGAYSGLFRSLDGGSTWTNMPAAIAAAAGAQLGYDQTVGVDPLDPNRVYLGFQELHLSTDGGATFQSTPITVGQVHEDHHALVFSPPAHLPTTAPSPIYVGTDGGIATSLDGGTTWLNLNAGIGTNLFLGIDIGRGSSASNGFSYGGTQDTGFPFRQTAFPGTDWHMTFPGDGGQVAVDPDDPRRAYGCLKDGAFLTTIDGGNVWYASAVGLPFGISRVVVDPGNGTHVYASQIGNLYQSTDRGAHFSLVHTFTGYIRAIAVAALDSNTVWVALDTELLNTANALAGSASTWTARTTGAPGWLIPEAVAIDPTDKARVVAAYSGYSGVNPANRTQHVYQTADGGTSWKDISGTDGGNPLQNLPDLPLHSLVIDPGVTIRGLFGVRAAPATVKGLGGPVIGVGLDGIIVTSTDGFAWTVQRSRTRQTLVDAAWDGSQWIVVGLGGTILTSPDGVTWTSRDSHTSDALQGIAWSGASLVASDASAPNVITSPDGITWTVRPLGTSSALLSIDWDGRQFIGVGYNGAIVTSPDGVTWTARASGTTANLGTVTSGQVRVVAGQAGALLTSPDGITWTVRNTGVTTEVDGVAFSGLRFVAVLNDGGVLTSPDGATWTHQSWNAGVRLNAVAWSGTQFVAVGDFGRVVTSPDGVTWAPQQPGSVPSSVVVAGDAGVMQSLDGGATWHVPGVGLPTVDCKSLAIDTGPSPSVLRVGTYGRSVFELIAPTGPVIVVNSNLAFGYVPVGSSMTLQVRAFNVGSASLDLASFALSAGSSDFSVGSGATPTVLAPGDGYEFSIAFTPGVAGDSTAAFRLYSTDPARPVIDVPASGTGY